MAVDWERVRAGFPALRKWTCLNTATFGQVPRQGREAITRHLNRRDANACSDFLDWFSDADGIRQQVARLVNCDAGDVAFFPTSSAALSLMLGGLDWRPGDRLVTLSREFPNNLYYPALLGARGVEFVETGWEGFYDALSPRTRLVVISSVNYMDGFRPPLEEIAPRLRERGILLYVDGTQSVGALRFDFQRIAPAMLAVNAYKWLLAPTGAAFACVAPQLRERLEPNVVGWRSDVAWRDVDNLHHGAPRFADTAEKYEGGMLIFPSLYAMAASISLMLEIGPEAIEERVMSLAERLRDTLRGLGAKLISDGKPHYDSPVVAARFEGHDASALARLLKEKRILVSARHGNLRVSVHFYNNQQDLERLRQALAALL